MRRILTIFVMALMILAISTTGFARNHQSSPPLNKKECEAQGGNWINDQGEKYCLFAEPAGEVEISINFGEESDVPEEATDVWGENIGERDEDEHEFVIVFEYGEKQRGNVGARGTRGTYEEVRTCRESGSRNLLPGTVCDWLETKIDRGEDED